MNKEITWNVVNSLLAGALVLLGGLSTGNIEEKTIIISVITGLAISLSQFKKYWESEEKEYCQKRKTLGSFF